MSRHLFVAFYLCLCCALPAAAQQLHSISGDTMGTVYHIKWISSSPKARQAEIDAALAALNQQVSTYQSNSQIAKYNRSNPDQSVTIGDDFRKILDAGMELYRQTQGALDVTAAPLVNLWGFGPHQIAKIPSDSQIKHAQSKMGLSSFKVQNQHLTKKVAGATLDFSAIAKGYGVDRIAHLLEQHGIEDYMVEIGGEVRLKGLNQQRLPWKIAILKPDAQQQQIQQIIRANNLAIATSGDYLNFYRYQDKVYSHLIDPQLGKPITNHIASVTVLHPSCMYADGYATALSVMGVQRALAFANEKALPVMIIERRDEQFSVFYAGGFKDYIIE
ncbi:FAD:protein FMN transferase [Shewanella sp. Isolate8]|uniref:FAD:protein FMN transferase n=1 Tax=Shewanella sp. Isolate8 TaxID=2908529 RepID=UPI001EFCEA54|nr:FAD:protein FMN transferase [Shewanella sp. Isolate8]MCG9747900.1 FAD:protein FMN transferase [Shewanella sp. Isolate8]